MPDLELVDYIQEQTQQGVSAQDLRVSLMEAGWHESDINNALHDVAAGLHPTTPGASIHEDLAQVRGMVAHLASRVHSIEASLSSVGSIGMQEQLPSGTLGPDHEIAAPHHHAWTLRTAALAALLGLLSWAGIYAAGGISQASSLPAQQLAAVALGGALLMAGAVVAMRRHRGWLSSALAAIATVLWGVDTYVAWRVTHAMQWSVAAALAVLLVVVLVVAGRWISRLAR